jgi:hypothetical protein
MTRKKDEWYATIDGERRRATTVLYPNLRRRIMIRLRNLWINRKFWLLMPTMLAVFLVTAAPICTGCSGPLPCPPIGCGG